MSNQPNSQPSPSADQVPPVSGGDLPQEELELGLSESVGFTMTEEGSTNDTIPAAEPSSAPPQAVAPTVPSGPDLGLSESVGFTHPTTEKESLAPTPRVPLPPLPTEPPAPAPPRPHPTHRLEQAWALMSPVEVASKPPGKPVSKPAVKKTPALGKPQSGGAEINPPKLPIQEGTEPTHPLLGSRPVQEPVAASAPSVSTPPVATLPSPAVKESEGKNPGKITLEQVVFLRGQIRQLQIWAWSATVLSVVLLILLWATRPPSAFHPPVETPPGQATS